MSSGSDNKFSTGWGLIIMAGACILAWGLLLGMLYMVSWAIGAGLEAGRSSCGCDIFQQSQPSLQLQQDLDSGYSRF